MSERFFGRQDILRQLNGLWRKSGASLVACRGRRRIGKSTLIQHFSRISEARLLDFEGLAPQPKMTGMDQLEFFSRRLSELTGQPYQPVDSWFTAFRLLDEAIPEGPCVILLDEISWMGKYDANFPGELKFAFDKRFRNHDSLIVVLCGSVSSWIEKNILSNTGFVGRISLDIVVPELSLSEAALFWKDVRDRVSNQEILDLLSITGGVPRYLEEVYPSISADENVKRMCFTPNGYLFRDFDDIFSSLFAANSSTKKAILHELALAPSTATELVEKLGLARNGQFTETIKELEMAGFVAADLGINPATGKRAKSPKYRLRDNYTRFFLKYVMPHEEEVRKGHYAFMSLENLPEWRIIQGLQFENLILNNIPSLITPLGLEGIQIFSASSFYRKGSQIRPGVQIDLLIQTRKSYMVVEIKHCAEIGEEVERDVKEKIKRLQIPKDMSVRTALIYSGKLSKTVSGSGFFDVLVSASDLLG